MRSVKRVQQRLPGLRRKRRLLRDELHARDRSRLRMRQQERIVCFGRRLLFGELQAERQMSVAPVRSSFRAATVRKWWYKKTLAYARGSVRPCRFMRFWESLYFFDVI